jgi:hypothetical protein
MRELTCKNGEWDKPGEAEERWPQIGLIWADGRGRTLRWRRPRQRRPDASELRTKRALTQLRRTRMITTGQALVG